MTELELKKYSRNALLGSFVSMLTAGLATMMYSVCISTIRTDLALTAVQAGSLGTYTFMGQMLGGMVAGYLADRFGRKNILIVDVILATLAVFATSLLQSYSIFGLLRFVTGVGLGGCYYIASILIGEFVPTNKRGFMSGVATSVWNFGYVVCCAMSAFALPSIGWRWCFRICALPIIFVIFMIFGMKDAPSFTAAKANRDKRDQAEGKKVNAYAEIWAHPRMRKSFIIWSISMILYFYGYYGLITWLPNYVQSQVGMQSGGWITAAGYIAMIIGTAGGGKIADKIGRKKLFLIGTIGTAIFGLCLAFWANSSNILVLMLLYGVCYGMPTGIHATFIGECFPTHLRSTGVGFTFNIGRLGAFVAPILMGKLVDMNMISVAIATVTMFASYFITQKLSGMDAQMQGSMKVMMLVMNLMFVTFCFNAPVGFSLYYGVSNVVQIFQSYVTYKIYSPEKFKAQYEAELAAKRAEKKKKRTVTVEQNGKQVEKEVTLGEANKLRLEMARQREAELYKDERTTPLNKD